MNPSRPRRAFTLVELLVVISVIMLLTGMVSTLVMTSRTAAMKNASRAVIGKVDAALRLFRNESGAYPWQPAANTPDDTAGAAWGNRLAWNLGTTLSKADLLKLIADQDAAAAQFTYDCTPGGTLNANAAPAENLATLSAVAYRKAWIQPSLHGTLSSGLATYLAVFLNRMAQERSRVAIAAGWTGLTGPVVRDLAGTVQVDRSALTVLGGATSSGWAADYLGGDLEPRYRRDDQILDAWRRPLIYICQVLPGERMTTYQPLGRNVGPFDSAYYGLGPVGRIALARNDAGGIAVATDPLRFPDATVPLASDARYYCAPGQAYEFELHSAGADGRFAWLRNDPANTDNVQGGDYARGLR